MKAVVCDGVGGPEVMRWQETADPQVGPDDVLIHVTATAVNRADLAQREGRYPVPPGASPILGLECSGIVVDAGRDVSTFRVGDSVMALVTGGAYAELVAVPETQVMPVPTSVSVSDAGSLPEVLCTVYSNLVRDARLRSGQTVLVHGGGSGIGTMAIQVVRALGAIPFVTVGSAPKAERCLELGAERAINYRTQDFVAEIHDATDGRGVDVLLDCIGADYLQRNLDALANDGTALVIGLQSGAESRLDLTGVMRRRLSLRGSTLRARPANQKQEIVSDVARDLLPLVESGVIKPVIDQRYRIEEVAAAHAFVGEGRNVGKVLLEVG